MCTNLSPLPCNHGLAAAASGRGASNEAAPPMQALTRRFEAQLRYTYSYVSHPEPSAQTTMKVRGGPVQKRMAAVIVALVGVWTVSSAAQSQSKDPWIGTWKTDLAKSTFSPGPKPAVAATVTIERSGGGMKTTIDAADPEGKPTHTETVWMFDGKDHPVKGALAPNTTATYKRIDDRTFEVENKVDGKPTTTTRVAISTDGKMMTATQTGKNVQGENVNNVIVASKQ
jgi:hypothetical protein